MDYQGMMEEGKVIARLASRLDLCEQTLAREKDKLAKSETRLLEAQQAQETLQHLAQAVQQQAYNQISEVVSSCLSSVFDDPYEFKIVFERKRGRTEASLRFHRHGLDLDPLTASGGGMVDVAAFALRVACLMQHRPRLNRMVVLDEPMKYVSAEFRPRVREMLEKLSKEMKMQVIMVTHSEDLVAGKVIQL